MDYKKQAAELLTIIHNGCIIHKEGNRFRWGTNFFSTEQEAKDFIDKPKSHTMIEPGVFVGEDHPLHPKNKQQ